MRVCEVCGQPIRGTPHSVIIDGGKFTVCNNCARLGTPVAKPAAPAKPILKPLNIPKHALTPKPRTPNPILREPELELRPDYNIVVKQAREKLNLSQEELGRKINEKPSLIRLIETGRLKPNDALASKVKHFLRVDLFVSVEELA